MEFYTFEDTWQKCQKLGRKCNSIRLSLHLYIAKVASETFFIVMYAYI